MSGAVARAAAARRCRMQATAARKPFSLEKTPQRKGTLGSNSWLLLLLSSSSSLSLLLLCCCCVVVVVLLLCLLLCLLLLCVVVVCCCVCWLWLWLWLWLSKTVDNQSRQHFGAHFFYLRAVICREPPPSTEGLAAPPPQRGRTPARVAVTRVHISCL